MALGEPDEELYERSRAQFPVFDRALAHMAFMENAGGSQVSACRLNNLMDCLQLLKPLWW